MDFDLVSTGITGLDKIIDALRLGDNVVWQVDKVDEYRQFALPFVTAAQKQAKKLIYIRFGQHPAIIPPSLHVKTYPLEPGRGFETFSGAIRTIITEEGEGAYYVFDSLSDLLSDWSTDLMVGNFFLITCPYLFQLKTVAYFAILRDRHSHQTIARIRDTTQILLDLFYKDRFYIHPIKVWRRYSPTMFLPHVAVGEDFLPLTNSADVAELFSAFPNRGIAKTERKLDYWDHLFLRAADLAAKPADDPLVALKQQKILEQLLKIMISRNESILALARRFFTLQDLIKIKMRLIGSGFIGGKATGLLLARAILAADDSRDWAAVLEQHDSFYIGSDVYYTYLVENGCWQLRQAQKKAENYFGAAGELKERLSKGSFPEAIREQFIGILEYFGQAPLIVRSSSLLEDGFGNAFAGKYESVFCVNQGSLSERYDQFVQAIRCVYASTMNDDALVYRKQRGLADSDEQMALLVQRVSGSHHGGYFFPDLAGVGLSYNSYVWHEEMNPQAGMVRLVYGLGTRAVDRVEDDYVRIVSLDQPLLNPVSSPEEGKSFIQYRVDVLNLGTDALESVAFQDLARPKEIPNLALFAEPDNGSEFGPTGRWVLNFHQLLKETEFPALMHQILKILERAYCYPVDTEFTVNFRTEDRFTINLLQCRPLQIRCNQARVTLPENIPADRIIMATHGRIMGDSLETRIATIVYVVPALYAGLTIAEKYQVARIIGQINHGIADPQQQPTMLLGPGRWGTSTPSLGIAVSFAEISQFLILGEIAFQTAGFIPDISYGTHFFHDLVETGIFYLALNGQEPDTRFNEDYLLQQPNSISQTISNGERWREVIRVVRPAESAGQIWFHADIVQQRALCWFANKSDAERESVFPL